MQTTQTELHGAKINVNFDPTNKKQIEEAKTKYRQAKKEGRKILGLDGEVLPSFSTVGGGFIIDAQELKDAEFAIRIFDDTGDRRLVWNVNDPDQIKEAKAMFDKYAAKGWRAYAVTPDGKQGRRVYGFRPETEEILFDESSTTEKLKDFVKSFKKSAPEIKMVPRTYPG